MEQLVIPLLARRSDLPRIGKWGRRTVFIVKPGDVYNKLTVICKDHGRGRAGWKCRCECGGEKVYKASDLATGHVKSCGCSLREILNGSAVITHGHSSKRKSGTYQTWQHMLSRCRNPNDDNYLNYGGRGVTVSEHWQSFENFLASMGERPDGKSLDRFPNKNGNYGPENCRWATPSQQAQNSRRAKLTPEQAKEIRALKGSGLSARSLGKRFGVAGNRISAIWRGESWREF